MAATCEVFSNKEEDLIRIIRTHATERGYGQLVSSDSTDWQTSIRAISRTLASALDCEIEPLSYRGDSDYAGNRIAEFGIRQARLHRTRGVSLPSFLGMLKCYRAGYLDLARAGDPEVFRPAEVDAFFDWVELGICAEWSAHQHATADAELKRTISLLNATLDSTPDGILVVNLAGEVSSFNLKFQKMWNIPDDLIAAKNDTVLLDFVLDQLKEPDQFREGIRAMYSDPDLVASDRLEFLDGRVFERYSQPQRLGDQIVGRVWVFRDVTSYTKLQAQLIQAQRMQSIGRLAGGVAHDFNNLLTVINGHASLLLSQWPGLGTSRAGLQEIHRAGERAAALTQQLLAFSSRQVMQARALNLNALVRDMEPMLVRLIGENIELLFHPGPDLANVRADRAQMEQVLMNLVINARDAMPAGGTLIVETANAELDDAYAQAHPGVKPGPYVMLAVSDTGTGMDERTRALIFEPFFTTKPAGKGTGLGLATVYGIVKQSGGNVWVYSELGRGTTFKIYLPLVEQPEENCAPAEPVSCAGGSETILIVEDQPQLRRLASAILQSYGYKVIEAENAEKALALSDALASPIDLVLTDVVMPGLSGPQLAGRIRESRPQVKVLYMSGYTGDMVLRQGVLDSELDYIQKPFTPSGLAQKVREALSASAPRQRILLADDDAPVRGFLKAVLDGAGYEVLEAADGDQALAVIRSSPVALAVVDLVMPNREGMETIDALRREFPALKMIAVSGAFGGQFLHTAALLGAHATLAKPITPDSLLRTVRSLLER